MAQSTMARGMADQWPLPTLRRGSAKSCCEELRGSAKSCRRDRRVNTKFELARDTKSVTFVIGSTSLDLTGREFGNMQEQLVLYHPDSCQPMQQPRLDDQLALLLQSVFHRETNTVHVVGSSDGLISTSALTHSRFLGALYLSSECYSRPSHWWQMCASFGGRVHKCSDISTEASALT